MRIISKSRLTAFWVACSQAEGPLREWYSLTAKAQWGNFVDLKQIYSSADQVKVRSGNTVTVFNIGGNKWRLIAAVHYNTKTVYVLSVMTHEEYDENKWKEKSRIKGRGIMASTPKQRTLKTRHRIVCTNRDIGVDSECLYPIWPLRNEEDYSRAVEVVDKLAVKGEEQLAPLERDQLEVFSTLIEKYEDEHHNIKPLELSPIDFLKLLMRENGMNASDLGKLLGDRALGYRVLKGERGLSKSHIKILSDHFKVDASSFI